MKTIRIISADDHAIVRSGLKQLMSTTADIAVVGEAANGAEVMSIVRRIPADLLLLDLSLPGIHGSDLIRRLRSEHTGLPIVILSMHNEKDVVTRMLRAGAAGYVTKDAEPETLFAAIRKVAHGGRYIEPALADELVFDMQSSTKLAHAQLSDREMQVLQLIASGRSNGDIGHLLCLSAKTVSTHKTRMLQKLHLKTTADLVRYAIANGLADHLSRPPLAAGESAESDEADLPPATATLQGELPLAPRV
ncbi:MAG: DNA-binding response regulator [Candidatus Accumulibacter sp. 66-26]|nr:response regulator transcription factor [Accumulibacter sp.]OJW52394.1 MAG: DNA-binding response regulator [Candidatus Accumulibacter sp. 66-26]